MLLHKGSAFGCGAFCVAQNSKAEKAPPHQAFRVEAGIACIPQGVCRAINTVAMQAARLVVERVSADQVSQTPGLRGCSEPVKAHQPLCRRVQQCRSSYP